MKKFLLSLFIVTMFMTSCTMLLTPATDLSEHDETLINSVFDSESDSIKRKLNSLIDTETNSNSMCGYTYTYDNIAYNIELYTNNLELFVELKEEKTIEKFHIDYETIRDITLIHECCHILNFSNGHGSEWKSAYSKYLKIYLENRGFYSKGIFEYYMM